MSKRDRLIHDLIWKEVADKSPSATGGFMLAAVFVYFHHFHLVDYKIIIQAASVLVLVFNLLRMLVANKIGQREEITSRNILILKLCIWCNAVAWAVIFTFSSLELHYGGTDFILMISILIGFAAVSTITLGYDLGLFLPFQLLTIFPVMILSFYQGFTEKKPDAQYLGYLLLIFIVYQFRQFGKYRGQILQRFNYQVDLEASLEEVKKSKEALVQQTVKLVHASRISALGDMAGGLAHEINNSLQVIMVSDQQIQRELKKLGLESESIAQKFSKSISAIGKIKSVVDGLKYFSLQMEPQEKEHVLLKDVLERALNYTFELIKAHNIRFEMNDIPDVKIYCHPFQITQVIFNIIKNADDALQAESADSRWIRLTLELKKGCLYIRITNSGTKISQEQQERLFLPFFSTKDVNQGTGLSLSISRGIALDHKGDLYFDPEEEFTTFVLKIPIV